MMWGLYQVSTAPPVMWGLYQVSTTYEMKPPYEGLLLKLNLVVMCTLVLCIIMNLHVLLGGSDVMVRHC